MGGKIVCYLNKYTIKSSGSTVSIETQFELLGNAKLISINIVICSQASPPVMMVQ